VIITVLSELNIVLCIFDNSEFKLNLGIKLDKFDYLSKS